MNIYSAVLFLHIVGALGFFVVEGLEWIGLSRIRTVRLPEEAHAIIGLLKRTGRLAPVSILTIVTTGIYMMVTVWGSVPWILVVLGSLVLEISLHMVLTAPRVAAIERALETEKTTVSNTFHALMNDPILWISMQTSTAILLGIVFLKIAKPDIGGSLLTIGIAIVLGLAPSLHVRPPRRMIALFVTAAVAALGLLAVNFMPASTTPFATLSGIPDLSTKPATTQTEAASTGLSTQTPTPSPVTALPGGQLLLQTRCTGCHELEWLQGVKKTRLEWGKTLSQMAGNAKLSDAQKNVLLDYLTLVNKP
jgi:hypothetical protein